jgi:hypothetical protein
MNPKQSAVEKIKRNLFLPKELIEEKLSTAEEQRRQRVMLCITRKMDDPILSDKELVDFLMSGCGGICRPIAASQAYRDILVINQITGNIQLASKDYERYMVVETAKKQIAACRDKDPKAVAALLKVIVMARALDKDDNETLLDQMLPPNFEPVADASVLGENVKRIKDADKRREELRALFNSPQIEDAEIIQS